MGFDNNTHDNYSSKKINLRSEHSFSDIFRAQFSLGFSDNNLDHYQIEPQQTDFGKTNQKDSHFSGNLFVNLTKKNALTIRTQYNKTDYIQRWPTCYFTSFFIPSLRDLYNVNPVLAQELFSGGSPTGTTAQEIELIDAVQSEAAPMFSDLRRNICGIGNQDSMEIRKNIEISNTYIVSDNFKINGGIGYWKNKGESETFYNGKTSSDYRYAFSSSEYSPNDLVTFNIGGMYEKISTVNKSAFSPRLGANFHLNESSTLRLVYSTGRRMPSLDETNRKWSYRMRDWDREVFGMTDGWFFLTALSNRNLKPEKIESYELGIYGKLKKVTYDIKVYKENLSDLISEKALYFDFNLTNNSEVDLYGFESELNYKLDSNNDFRFGLSVLESDASNQAEETLYSRYQGYLSTIHRFDHAVLGLSYTSNSVIGSQSFDRVDMSLSGDIIDNISWRFVITKNLFDYIPYERNVDDVVLNGYDESLHFKFSLSAEF